MKTAPPMNTFDFLKYYKFIGYAKALVSPMLHVKHVLVSQETPKLQAVKLFSFFKNYIFLFMYHIVI